MRDVDTNRRVEDLYREHGRQVLGYLARRSSADEAGDLMADVFEVVWRRRKHLPAPGEEKLWAFGIARNILLNHRRRQRRQQHHETRQLADSIREATQSPTQAEQDLRAALDLLEPLDREIITLTFWEGFNFVEVAALLRQPAPTIRTRYRRARLRLHSALQLGEPVP